MPIQPRPEVARLRPYIPGRPIAEVEREFGLSHVIKLASNENPLGPSPMVQAAVQVCAGLLHLYPESSARELRQALSRHLGLADDWILVGNGSDEILRLLAATYIRPGDRSVVPACTFPNYRTVSELFGANVTEVPLRDERMDLDAMAWQAVSGDARVIFLCRPNNPTGAVFTEESFKRLMAAVPPSTLVILDQAYHEFDESPFDSMAVLHAYPNLVLTRTFSKAYGLGGLRVGYGMARPEIWQLVSMVREPFSVNYLAQAAALVALEDRHHLGETLSNNRAGKLFLMQLCRDLGLPLIPSQANFLMINLKRGGAAVSDLLLRQGVIVRPCAGFGRPEWIRVSVGTPEELRRFDAALRHVLGL